MAKKSGADAVKIQTYTPDDITLDIKKSDFIIKNKYSPWNKKTLFKLYEKAHTPLEWHKEIYSYAKKQKIICFSSVFNERRVDFLENWVAQLIRLLLLKIIIFLLLGQF